MANGVVCSNSGTELILIWTDISHGIKSLAAIYSDSFVACMCVRCIFYVRMYLNWELRQEDEIVYAIRIIVLNYDGTYLLWFAWRCYFTVYWARCACVRECLCVCSPHFTLHSGKRHYTPSTIQYVQCHLQLVRFFFLFISVFQRLSHAFYLCTLMITNDKHTHRNRVLNLIKHIISI